MRALACLLTIVAVGLWSESRAENLSKSSRCTVKQHGVTDREKCVIDVGVSVVNGECHLDVPKYVFASRTDADGQITDRQVLVWRLKPNQGNKYMFDPNQGVVITNGAGVFVEPGYLNGDDTRYKLRDRNPSNKTFDYSLQVVSRTNPNDTCKTDPVIANQD